MVPHELLTTNADDVVNDPEISICCRIHGRRTACDGLHAPRAGKRQDRCHGEQSRIALNGTACKPLHSATMSVCTTKRASAARFRLSTPSCQPLQANRIDSLMGISNGTTNYIPSRMYENGEDYEAVLHDAQRWGWLNRTHPPMSRDWTRPISSLLWRALPSTRAYRSARSIVKASRKLRRWILPMRAEMGYVLKLLAIAKRSGSTIEVRVHPTLIANDHPLSQVNGSFNAVYLHGHACKEMMLQGLRRGRFADGERGGGRHSPCRDGGCACASDVCEQRKCGCVAGVHERLENAVFPAFVDSGRAGFAGEDCDVAVERAGVDCNVMQKAEAGGKPRAADYHYA